MNIITGSIYGKSRLLFAKLMMCINKLAANIDVLMPSVEVD